MSILAIVLLGVLHCAQSGIVLSDVEKWRWSGPLGPLTWGITWPQCAEKLQSPTNIPFLTINTCLEPVHWYNLEQPQPYATLQNAWRSAVLFLDPAYPVYVQGGGLPSGHSYHVIGLFFHVGQNDTVGSQHQYYNRDYPMEIIVIMSSDPYVDRNNWINSNSLAAASFLVAVAPTDNKLWDPVISELKNVKKGGSKANVNLPSLLDLLPHYQEWNTHYASYTGSLPHPPCTQGVVWINYPTAIALSSEQIAQFRTLEDELDKAIIDNRRGLQGLDHRQVILSAEKVAHVPQYGVPVPQYGGYQG